MNRERGFSIIMAIFILLILALLGGYMVRMTGVQQYTMMLSLQSARGHQAARAGLEWGIASIAQVPVINSATECQNNVDGASLSFTGLTGFTVNLTCTQAAGSPYTEGSKTYYVYTINSTSEYGSFTDPSYINRQLQVSLRFQN